MNDKEFIELVKKCERYDILVKLIEKNTKKYSDTLMITNDRVIIEFLQTVEEIQIEDIPKIEKKEETAEIPF